MPTYSLQEAQAATGEEQFQLYGALDTTGTLEIFNTLRPRLNPDQERTYRWSLAQQSPALAMGMRGIRVDTVARSQTVAGLRSELGAITKAIGQHPLVTGVWDATRLQTGTCPKAPLERKHPKHKWPRAKKGEPALDPRTMKCELCGAPRTIPAPFEPSSPIQTARLFYDLLKVPKQTGKTGGLTTDDEALDKIARLGISERRENGKVRRAKLEGLPELCDLLRGFRDATKQLDFLGASLTTDGRFPSSFNVAAPWTGRWSSSKSPFGQGGNLQNVGEKHRRIFVADPGYEMFYSDLKTAESLHVAYLSGDTNYIKAHEGDVHTWVCRELWPDLPWTGDIKQDKKLAQSTNPEWDKAPGHDLRFQSKRVQHGPLADFMEVLTPNGWVEVRHMPGKIATWDETGEVRMEAVGWVEGETDKLIFINGRNVKQVVSPDHRLPRVNNGKLGEILAGDVDKRFGRWPVTGALHGGVFEPFAKLWAATWADGALEKKYPNSVRFSVAKERKALRLRELCAELGLKLWESFSGGQWHMRVYGFHRKALSWDMLGWDVQSRLAFLNELPLWDGSTHNGQLRVFNTDLEGMSIIQALCHTTARAANINKHGKPRPNEVQCFQLTVSNRTAADWAGVKFAHAYCGARPAKVYCPRTTRGWVLTRYKGVVSVTGNSNYGLSPAGLAMIAHIPRKAAEQAQANYFKAFPEIKEWQHHVGQRVKDQLPLYNALRRMVILMGRPWDGHTYKQGLAFEPQSGIGDVLNLGLWRLWRYHDPVWVEVLAQIHDAVLGQYLIENRETAQSAIMDALRIPVPVTDFRGVTRTCTIQAELAVGQNWGKRGADNPEGMEEVK